ncbi:MAG: GNAT family N-acetyltransferase [Candidatus ainarchaeum sp.]|nr:GNAT family N-acetyltransferase [Candidatus ainarchaeum sp.]
MRLSGERIFLRPWKKSDIPRIAEICSDKTISRFTHVPFPYAKKHARNFVSASEKARRKKREFNFAVVLKKENKLIGSASLMRLDWHDKLGVVGYWLARENRGQGIMPEACLLLLDFGFNKLKLHRIEIDCAVGNRASRRVIEKLGFSFECIKRERGLLGNKFTDVRSYSMLDREFKKKKNKTQESASIALIASFV